MFLQRLRLKNFRQFREADIEFCEGVTAIVGLNGSGKTTLLESISWALYGKHRNLKETLCHRSAKADEKTSVILNFSLGSRMFSVERSFEKASLKEKVNGDDKLLVAGLSDVSAESEKLLRLTYEQFKNSFCAEQKELEFLKFNDDKEKRQEQIAKMLGFDDLRIAAGICKEKSRRAKDRLEGLKEALAADAMSEQDYKQTASEVKDLGKLLQDAKSAFENKKEELRKLKPKKDAAEESLKISETLEAQKGLGKTLKSNIENHQQTVTDLKRELEEKARLDESAKCFEEIETEIQVLRERQKKAQDRRTKEAVLAKAESDIAELHKKHALFEAPALEQCERILKKATSELEASRTKLVEEDQRWAAAKADAQRSLAVCEEIENALKKSLDQAAAAEKDGKCATCGQLLPDGHLPQTISLRKELASACADTNSARKVSKAAMQEPESIKRLEAAIKQKEAEKAEAETKRETAKFQMEQRRDLDDRIGQTSKEIETLRKDIKTLPVFDDKVLVDAQKRYDALKPKRERWLTLQSVPQRLIEAERQLEKAVKEFEEIRKNHQSLEERLASLGMDKKECERILREYADCEKHLNDLETKTATARTILVERKLSAEKAKQRFEQYKEQKKRADELDKEYRLQSEAFKGLVELRTKLNATTKPRLEQYAGEALSQLTAGRYYDVTLDEKYSPILHEGGIQKPVISGGEEDVVALALRLALAQMIQERSGQPMSLLILDEVFGSLDPDRRQSVLEKLKELRDSFRQILIISHIETINDGADQCLSVTYDPLEKVSSISAAARIEQLAAV